VMRAPAGSGVPHAVSTKVVLYADQPYVDLEITVHDKPADPWPEAGWICLPFQIDTPQFHLGRLASIIDPVRDIVPGANRHLLGLNTGLTITDRHGSGVGLCAMDHPLVSLDAPGCWKYSLDFVPRKSSVYVNLFNNQWTTNFRLWNQGTWTSRVRLWAFDHYQSSATLVMPSYEARLPLLAAAAQGSAGTLTLSRTGLELSRRGVVVTAFGPNPDGSGTVLRLWELSGQSGECQVRLPAGMAAYQAQPVDLRGRPRAKPIRIQKGSFMAPMSAFAPTSYVLE
jgi:alpha-mannosidase